MKFSALFLVGLSWLIVAQARVAPSLPNKESILEGEEEASPLATLDCSTASRDIHSFTVGAEYELGSINLLYVQHNGARKIPYATTALYNSLNQNKNVTRVDNFRKYACDYIEDRQTDCKNTYRMTDVQRNTTGEEWTSWDRGHLTPVNPFRFSDTAMDHTFFCVNIAPQEPFTNRQPWFTIEDRTHQKLSEKPGYVMTGVCDRDSPDGVTEAGWRVPECFWKLVCFNDDDGITRVVGFIGNNTLFHRNDTQAKEERVRETTKPRSQSEILELMDMPIWIEGAWRNSKTFLLDNRFEENAPDPVDCIRAVTAPLETLIEWGLEPDDSATYNLAQQ